VFVPSDEFVVRGREKVEQAIYVYETFFCKDAQQDINQFVHHEIL